MTDLTSVPAQPEHADGVLAAAAVRKRHEGELLSQLADLGRLLSEEYLKAVVSAEPARSGHREAFCNGAERLNVLHARWAQMYRRYQAALAPAARSVPDVRPLPAERSSC